MEVVQHDMAVTKETREWHYPRLPHLQRFRFHFISFRLSIDNSCGIFIEIFCIKLITIHKIFIWQNRLKRTIISIHCHLLQSSRCVGSSGRKKERAPMSPEMLDLLQVDLLASGAYLVWPRGGRPRATKSRFRPAPYEIRRRTFLKV